MDIYLDQNFETIGIGLHHPVVVNHLLQGVLYLDRSESLIVVLKIDLLVHWSAYR